MADFEAVFDSINTNIENLNKTKELMTHLPEEIILKYAYCRMLNASGKLLLEVNEDYEKLLSLLKLLRNKGQKLSFRMAWSSGPRMMFSWEDSDGQVEVWFTCNPLYVPKGLLPSPDCEVKAFDDPPSQSYKIVCSTTGEIR